MTEFKTNYKRYMHNVKGEFMRYQGNLKEYLGRNSPPGFYKCFKSRRQDRKCNLGIENLFEHFKNLVVSKDNECIDFL